MDPAIIGGGLKLLGGILGRPKTIGPGRALMSHAKGAIKASRVTGFNPLTLLGVGNAGYAFKPALASDAFMEGVGELAGALFTAPKFAPEVQAARLNERARLEQESKADPLQSFGYALNKVEPLPVTGRFISPQLASPADQASAVAADTLLALRNSYVPKAPVSSSDEVVAPPQMPLKFLGMDIWPSGQNSDSEAFEGRLGDTWAEVLSVPAGLYELGHGFGGTRPGMLLKGALRGDYRRMGEADPSLRHPLFRDVGDWWEILTKPKKRQFPGASATW